jgi:8-oxo-dGTP pyrophosphatase MutT (NUDIX family)
MAKKKLARPKLELQVAALPFRKRGKSFEILLITSRETRRWVIPKGWPMKGKKDWNAAAIEGYEEAGIKGDVNRKSIGTYQYFKRRAVGGFECEVTVYPFEVTKLLDQWPEKDERRRKWFEAARAAELVEEEGLQAIIAAVFT